MGLSHPSEWLHTGEAELCTVRWGAAFLCEFGCYWGDPSFSAGPNQRKFLEELFSSCFGTMDSLKYVTFLVNGARSHIPNYFEGDNQKSGVYGGTTGTAMSYRAVKGRDFVLENIASAYPAIQENDRYVFMDLVLAILDFKCMDHPSLASLLDYCNAVSTPSASNGWFLLMWQCGELPPDKIPFFGI